ncbi:MAG: hypothetical protein ACLFRX_10865 [Gemmatimonadota bacterium]
MTDQPKKTGSANTPSTEAARTADTHPASEATASGRHGGPPGTIASGDQEGPGQEGTARDPSITMAAQDAYWRRSFAERAYVDEEKGYEHYRPAYRYGWEARAEHGEKEFLAVEEDLRKKWDAEAAGLSWRHARPAVREAYERAPATEASFKGNPLA